MYILAEDLLPIPSGVVLRRGRGGGPVRVARREIAALFEMKISCPVY